MYLNLSVCCNELQCVAVCVYGAFCIEVFRSYLSAFVCCSELQCVAICCSVCSVCIWHIQHWASVHIGDYSCVAVSCNVWLCVAVCIYGTFGIEVFRSYLSAFVCCNALQCVAVNCSVCIWHVRHSSLLFVFEFIRVLQFVCCNELQWVAVNCSVYIWRIRHSSLLFVSEFIRVLQWLAVCCSVHVSNDAFICMTWLIHTCDTIHAYVCHDESITSHNSPECVIWLIHVCAMTHLNVWHRACSESWLTWMSDIGHDSPKGVVSHDSPKCVP